MTARLQLMLLAIVATAATTDAVWGHAGHFDIDWPSYGLLALIAAFLAAGGLFYEHIRRDEKLAAMLVGTSFLIATSAALSVLNYLLLTVAGHRIDDTLAAMDRALGVDWPAMMTFVSHHPLLDTVLQLAYVSVLIQIALLVVTLGFTGRTERIYSLCFGIAFGALITVAFWTVAPSFGAFSVYELPPDVARHLVLALDGHYARELVGLLAHGPGRIAPVSAQGLIGFPSYHAVMALLVAWHARDLPVLRWLGFGVNAVVLVATPIQGGHHVVDVLAGFAVAALAILAARQVLRICARPRLALKTQPAGL